MVKEEIAIEAVKRLASGPNPEPAIQVRIPARVAYNRDAMQKATGIVLDRLGCPQCHSGWDIRFEIERNFVFDEQLNLIR